MEPRNAEYVCMCCTGRYCQNEALDRRHLRDKTAWHACPFCHASPHQPCKSRQSEQVYPMGSFHLARRRIAMQHNVGGGADDYAEEVRVIEIMRKTKNSDDTFWLLASDGYAHQFVEGETVLVLRHSDGCGNPSCDQTAHTNQQWKLCDIARRKAALIDGQADG